MSSPNRPQPDQPAPAIERNLETDPHAPYERRDVNIRGILWLAASTAIGTVAISIGLWYLFGSYESQALRDDPKLSPLATDQVPPLPHLQDTPNRDYQDFLAEQEKQLATYGWADREQNAVRIPVERAMNLLAERGLPEPRPQPKQDDMSEPMSEADATDQQPE